MKSFCILLVVLLSSINGYSQIDTTEFKHYQFMFHKHKVTNADSAEYYISKMDSITKVQEVSISRHKYYDILGGWYNVKRNNKASLDAYKKSLAIARQLGDKGSEMLARFNVAGRIGDGGDLKRAIAEFKEVETLLGNSVRDHRIRIALYGNLTLFSLNLDDIPQAKHYNQLMHKHLKTYSDSIRYYITKVEISSIERKYQEELSNGLEALRIVKPDDLRSLEKFNGFVAKAYLNTGDVKKARIYLDRAKKVADRSGIENITLDLYFGEIAYLERDYSEALKYFTKVQNHAERSKDARLLTIVLPKVKETYYQLGLYKEAFERQKEDESLKDSLAGLESKKYVTEIEAKYELKEKERTIKQQERENQLQSENIRAEVRSKNIFAVLLGVCLLFLVAAVYLIRRVLKDKKEIAAQRNQIVAYATRLEESNKMRDKLFAMISHDLRSPISSLSSNLALYNDEKPSKRLQDTLISLSNIRLILNNLLKWASLKIKNDEPFLEEVNIGVLLDSVVSQVQSQTTGKDITILSNYNHRSTITTDEHYMQIVFRNLISNAVKFTPHEGFIRITTSETDNSVLVEIRDSGMGMPEEKLATLFSYPESSKGTSGETGTGLGLTLCKDLLDKVGGTIQVKSKPSVGTEFTVSLPVHFKN